MKESNHKDSRTRITRNKRFHIFCAAVLSLLSLSTTPPPQVIDSFEDNQGWQLAPADGVKLNVSSEPGYEGNALRIDFDFQGNSGWAAVKKQASLTLPDNYEFSFQIRGDAPVNNLEFKLSDASGENVWWVNRRSFEFPSGWKRIVIKKRHIQFAWGPLGGGELKEAASVEFAISSVKGGKGSVWIDDLTLKELPPAKAYSSVPTAKASSTIEGSDPKLVLDQDLQTRWIGAGGDQRFTIDFQENREYGGLVIEWERNSHALKYEVQISDEGNKWETVRNVVNSNGGRDYIYLPETESRYLSLHMQNPAGPHYSIRSVEIQPLEFSESFNSFFATIARDSPAGMFPSTLLGELSYWTIAGVDGGDEEALLNEPGALEPYPGSFSIEPFLNVDGAFITWKDVEIKQNLLDGYLPIPVVVWNKNGLTLEITVFANGRPEDSRLYAIYRIRNGTSRESKIILYLAVRPFQVNPPSQFLNVAGGAAKITKLNWAQNQLAVNDKYLVIPTVPPSDFGATAFDQGDITEYLQNNHLPESALIEDSFEHASGAFAYEWQLRPDEVKEAVLVFPYGKALSNLQDVAGALAETKSGWEEKLNAVEFELPDQAKDLIKTIKSNLAYILINRDGPSIQPGSRSYARSWIRDGSLTSSALLRLGQYAAAKEFIEWYAPFQYRDGKVPCCVDTRGADPVPEHDSHGELIFAITEYYRFTRDKSFAERMWPHVSKAVAYIDYLRQQRRTDEYREPEKNHFFGLLPESISHEGYSSKPVHSYWDCFFALKGLNDAAELAGFLGKEQERAKITAIRNEFQTDLYASIKRTMTIHNIDFIPGSADLGDFDATSTTIAVSPGGEMENLPQPALNRTFERYSQESLQRSAGTKDWQAYTPYELRTVGTFVRLGWKERAHDHLKFFMNDRRPQAWNHWAEVVHKNPREAKFIGDMPHTWVGSDFIRSVLDFFAYERAKDQSLVIGAGIPDEWARRTEGIKVRGLRTIYGTLNYSLIVKGNDVYYEVGKELEAPPGGIVAISPIGNDAKIFLNGEEQIAVTTTDQD